MNSNKVEKSWSKSEQLIVNVLLELVNRVLSYKHLSELPDFHTNNEVLLVLSQIISLTLYCFPHEVLRPTLSSPNSVSVQTAFCDLSSWELCPATQPFPTVVLVFEQSLITWTYCMMARKN